MHLCSCYGILSLPHLPKQELSCGSLWERFLGVPRGRITPNAKSSYPRSLGARGVLVLQGESALYQTSMVCQLNLNAILYSFTKTLGILSYSRLYLLLKLQFFLKMNSSGFSLCPFNHSAPHSVQDLNQPKKPNHFFQFSLLSLQSLLHQKSLLFLTVIEQIFIHISYYK